MADVSPALEAALEAGRAAAKAQRAVEPAPALAVEEKLTPEQKRMLAGTLPSEAPLEEKLTPEQKKMLEGTLIPPRTLTVEQLDVPGMLGAVQERAKAGEKGPQVLDDIIRQRAVGAGATYADMRHSLREHGIGLGQMARRVTEEEVEPSVVIQEAARRGVVALMTPEKRALEEQRMFVARKAAAELPKKQRDAQDALEEAETALRGAERELKDATDMTRGVKQEYVKKRTTELEEARKRVEELKRVERRLRAGVAPGVVIEESEELAPFLGIEAEDAPEIPKPGEKAYESIRRDVERMLADKSRLRIYEALNTKTLTQNWRSYVDQLRTKHLQDWGVYEELPVTDEQYKEATKRAVHELAALKTVGLWTGPIELPRSLDPNAATLGDAWSPRIEVIGLDNKNKVIVRQQSPLGYLFDLIDMPHFAVTGLLSEEGSISDRMIKGMAGRKEFFQYALEHPDAEPITRRPRKEEIEAALARGEEPPKVIREEAWRLWVYGLTGGAATIFFPDMTLLAGPAGKIAKTAKAKKLRRIASANIRFAEDTLRGIKKAAEEGNWKELQRLDAELAGKLKDLHIQLNIADADEALKRAKEVPGMIDVAAARALPKEAGSRLLMLHPAARKRKVEGPGGVKWLDPQELRDYDGLLKTLTELRAGLVKGDPAHAVRATAALRAKTTKAGWLDKAMKAVSKVEIISYRGEGVVSGEEVVDNLRQALDATLPRAIEDPDAWKKQAKDLVRKTIPRDEQQATRGAVYRQLDKIEKEARALHDPAALLDQAVRVVKANAEARGVAAAVLLGRLQGVRGIVEHPKWLGTPLSWHGSKFAFDVETTFKVSREEAIAAAAVMDARSRKWVSEGAGRTVADWWVTRLAEVMKGLPQAERVLDDGRAVVQAFERKDIGSLVREIGHIFRRDLSAASLKTAEDWAGVVKGRWTEAAEEKFARAFERYLRDGGAPSSGMAGVFERLKSFLAEIYRSVKGSEIDIEIPPEMQKVFDGLLLEKPRGDSTLLEWFRRGAGGQRGVTGEVPTAAVRLAETARRAGVEGVDAEDIAVKMADGEPFVFDRYVLGKIEWTPQDLAGMQKQLEATARGRAADERLLALVSPAHAVKESSPVEWLRSRLEGEGTARRLGQAAMFVLFGGDAMRDLRHLPEPVRMSILASARIVEEGIANAVRVAGERDPEKLAALLGGEIVEAREGRSLISSGFDSMGNVTESLKRWWEARQPKRRAALGEMAEMAAARDIEKIIEDVQAADVAVRKDALSLRDNANNAVMDAWYGSDGKNTLTLFRDISEAIPKMPMKAVDVSAPVSAAYALEPFLYVAGLTTRGKEKFTGSSEEAAALLLDRLASIWGEDARYRVGVLLGAHGHAARAGRTWVAEGLGVEDKTAAAFKSWVQGELIEDREVLREVLDVARRFDINPHFASAEGFLPPGVYVPQAARARLSQAIAMAKERENPISLLLRSKGGALEDLFGPVETMRGSVGVTLRYIKTRMVRGAFIPRQRYYFMNTIDHFNQMALVTDFRSAAVSTSRVVAQDLMAAPLFVNALYLAGKTGLVDPKSQEKARRTLQKGGDWMAHKLGELFRTSKYRISVNRVLDGDAGTISLGGRVYSYQDLRDIAAQEGIFASFDIAQLRNATNATVREANATWARAYGDQIKDFGHGWLRAVSDLAEGWSERERLGAMITLIEGGMDPRLAARTTIHALFDYAGSMSKTDRSWVMSMLFPFWAFQKNANKLMFDSLFSAKTAYKMGVLRRGQDALPEALSEILYMQFIEPYGVDVDALSPEMADRYWFVRNLVETHFGGRTKVPDDVRLALRGMFGGNFSVLSHGRAYELDAAARNGQLLAGTSPRGRVGKWVSPGSVTTHQLRRASRPSWLRERGGLVLPRPLVEEVRKWQSFAPADHPYTELFLPESVVHAGFHHAAFMLATGLLMSKDVMSNVNAFGLRDDGMDQLPIEHIAREIADPSRAPLLGEVVGFFSPKTRYPKKLHPIIATAIEDGLNIELVRTRELRDPTAPVEEVPVGPEEEAMAKAAGYPVKEGHAYLPPGALASAFENSPLGELNKMLLSHPWRRTPLEEAQAGREALYAGKIASWARALLGVQTYEVSPEAVARREAGERQIKR